MYRYVFTVLLIDYIFIESMTLLCVNIKYIIITYYNVLLLLRVLLYIITTYYYILLRIIMYNVLL